MASTLGGVRPNTGESAFLSDDEDEEADFAFNGKSLAHLANSIGLPSSVVVHEDGSDDEDEDEDEDEDYGVNAGVNRFNFGGLILSADDTDSEGRADEQMLAVCGLFASFAPNLSHALLCLEYGPRRDEC